MASKENEVVIDFTKVPLGALRDSARNILSQSLDSIKVLPTREAYPRDWRGIALLVGLPIQSQKMRIVLLEWSTKDVEKANFDILVRYLQMIDRWDVVDDLADVLIQDAQVFMSESYRNQTIIRKTQENEESNMPIAVYDEQILTTDDVERVSRGLPPQRYNAFLLFAKAEEDFALEIVNRLEKSQGFKFCLKNRNILGGRLKHETMLNIINNRCDCVMVIISNAFLKSPTKEFIVNYAVALQIEQRKVKILPCLYEKCQLPPILSYCTLLKYYQSSLLVDFWEKLKASLRNTHITSNDNAGRPKPSIQITATTSLPAQPSAIEACPLVSKPLTSAPGKIPHRKKTNVNFNLESGTHQALSLNQANSRTASNGNVSQHAMPLAIGDAHIRGTNLCQMSGRRKFKWYSKLFWSGNCRTASTSTASNESTHQRKDKAKK